MEAKVDIGPDGKGTIYYPGETGMAAEMEVAVNGGTLTVFHTGVQPEYENQGLAKGLLGVMTAYAREQKLKVKPLCPFVSAQFRRHPDQYADLWQPGDAL